MDKRFPPEIDQLLKAPNVRAAFISEFVSTNSTDCPNCGGRGFFYIFLVTIGPMNNPVSGRDIITHWADGKWWGGKGYEFDCPICQALTKPYKGTPSTWEREQIAEESPLAEEIAMLAEKLAVKP